MDLSADSRYLSRFWVKVGSGGIVNFRLTSMTAFRAFWIPWLIASTAFGVCHEDVFEVSGDTKISVPAQWSDIFYPEQAVNETRRLSRESVLEALTRESSLSQEEANNEFTKSFGEVDSVSMSDLDVLPAQFRDSGTLKAHSSIDKSEQANTVPLFKVNNRTSFELAIQSYLWNGVYTRAKLKMAQTSGMAKNIDSFYSHELSTLGNDKSRAVTLRSGQQVQIKKVKVKAYGEYGEEALSLNFGNAEVIVRRSKPPFTVNEKFMLTLRDSVHFYYSAQEYEYVTVNETHDPGAQARLMESLSKITEEERARLNELLSSFFSVRPSVGPESNAKAESENVSVSEKTAPVSFPAPTIHQPYTSFAKEAYDRFSGITLNVGLSMEGVRLVGLVLDQIYNEGENFEKINSIETAVKDFELQYLSQYAQELRAKETYLKIVNVIKSKKRDQRIQNLNAEILNGDQLDLKAYTISNENYYDGLPESEKPLSVLKSRNTQWLTLNYGHYLEIISIDALNRGQLLVYLKNLQRPRDHALHQIFMNSSGKFKRIPDTDGLWGLVAYDAFFDGVDHLSVVFQN